MGFSYSFEHGISVFFVYGEDGFDEIRPEVEEQTVRLEPKLKYS